jgi:hypothetical protein
VVEVIVVARCHPGVLTAVVAAVVFQPARQWAGRLASLVVYGRRAAVSPGSTRPSHGPSRRRGLARVVDGRLLQRLAERDHPVDAGQERRAVESSVAVGGRQLAAGLLPLGDVLRRAEYQVHAGQRCAQRAVLG